MKIFSIYEKCPDSVVVALGRFDGLHLGHQKVVSRAMDYAEDKGVKVALFTLKKQGPVQSQILSFEETVEKAATFGVDTIIYADETPQFFATDREDFLKTLFDNFAPKALFFGEDYTFGKDRLGTADYLDDYCKTRGVDHEKVSLLYMGGEKVSSTAIKEYLERGEIGRANAMLGGDYFMSGVVEKGRGDGHKMGFPTANILPDGTKMPIREGVYKTTVIVDKKAYKALTSIGTAPTFGNNDLKCESFVIGFDRELYGKQISVLYHEFLRDNIKFDTKEQLEEQIEKDLKIYD